MYYNPLIIIDVVPSKYSVVFCLAAQTFDGERFDLKKLNELEYQFEITNRSAALENLRDDKDINRGWENIKKNIKTSAKGV